jgi:hypothetical protein
MSRDQRIEQAWAEIRDTFADSMLNQSQKETFVKSILSGVLANPPGLETVPEGTMAVIQSLDDFQVEYKKFTRDNAPGNDYWSGKFRALIGSARAILTRHRATQCQHKWNSISMEFISYDICTECYGIGNKETGVIFCYVPEEKRLKPNNRATQDKETHNGQD